MRRPALYSRSSPPAEIPSQNPDPAHVPAAHIAAPKSRRRWRWLPSASDPRVLWSAIALLTVALLAGMAFSARTAPRKLTQEDINAAVLKTLENTLLPSAAAKAYDNIIPSVVGIVGVGKGGIDGEHSVGTGVVIVDKGIILTNLHVVNGAEVIKVTFADGLESIATVKSVQAANDLAVLQASEIPDDLIPATMRSTADLVPGDQVMAVGYPFGIGPSASSGVVSGLKRSFKSPEGKQQMTNLIQFDAAANPGNSGGPLVTMDGQVVGIVTAILNPTSARTFIGIGFAVPIENAASAVGLHPF